ncbi:hypothetical protein H113_09077, partial [Trichophyton rubrum MR1459]
PACQAFTRPTRRVQISTGRIATMRPMTMSDNSSTTKSLLLLSRRKKQRALGGQVNGVYTRWQSPGPDRLQLIPFQRLPLFSLPLSLSLYSYNCYNRTASPGWQPPCPPSRSPIAVFCLFSLLLLRVKVASRQPTLPIS